MARRTRHQITRTEYEPQRITYEYSESGGLVVDGAGSRRAGGDWITDREPFVCTCGKNFDDKQAARDHIEEVNADDNIRLEVYKRMYDYCHDIRYVKFMLDAERNSRMLGPRDIIKEEENLEWTINNVDAIALKINQAVMNEVYNRADVYAEFPTRTIHDHQDKEILMNVLKASTEKLLAHYDETGEI